ncbi:hypothetical protein SeMB42_g00703 [Synchytrium endobioticum]|uniref:Ubiquitin carboxyl-terminal hydrolase n=1 Tax=Synchytrium endobioticum TaxID=286115 RepID=A0A507DJW8_9FUNG|nr:hypothetical protein SeLEV6574_g00254 [Synchytrium endobioticum]TPX53545.1 hypothetical protein SeMB42_g00703 [Synchytrium endobioticum]
MSCTHVVTAGLKAPTLCTPIYKDECTQCFDSPDLPQGVDVCLSCFNGGCLDNDRNHALSHFLKNPSHAIALNMKRVRKPKPAAPHPTKLAKLAISVENDEDNYSVITRLKCYACGGVDIDPSAGNAGIVADAVLAAISAKKQSDIKAWEDEAKSCTHTENLQQGPAKKLDAQDLAHCAACELNKNLWLCLVCGNLGCGRKQWNASGVTGGNGHALQHAQHTGHGLACQLGTVTPEGTADVYCYTCDNERLNPFLSKHLAHFGIDVGSQEKTEKSMAELQLEHNLKFDFSMTTEDGKQLPALYGPGFTGLKNLGNSCYMASVLQTVFSLQSFRTRYFENLKTHPPTCNEMPANCYLCQMVKVADGLLSGRYSIPPTIDQKGEHETSKGQESITPAMFKRFIGKDHVEFSTMRQQDAYEFFQHLIRTVEQKERASGQDPTSIFKCKLEQRLQCTECGKVRYKKDSAADIALRVPAKKASKSESAHSTDGKKGEEFLPVTFEECLAMTLNDEVMEYQCPSCRHGTIALKSTKIAAFPDVLVTPMSRFTFDNWVLKKLNIRIQVPVELDLERYRARGLQPGESPLSDDTETSTASQFDAAAMEQLQAMGFTENRGKRALLATGNSGADAAMNWLFEHMEDPDIDDPLPKLTLSGRGIDTSASTADVQQLTEMGFSVAMAKKALKQTNNNMERAVDWLFSHMDDTADDEGVNGAAGSNDTPDSPDTRPAKYRLIGVISHKGTSPHCGHYVAHTYKEGKWVLFNDEKVAHVLQPDLTEGYVYVFARE